MSTNELGMDPQNPYYGEVIPPHLAIKAMRDSGYKNTAYALAELIDNSIQAGANLVEVVCIEKQARVNVRVMKRISEIGVFDNGCGMDDATLRRALQFGNGTRLEDRSGIGRFGMGLPNASISQCRRVDVWSWQAGPNNALHTYLDLDEIEAGKTRIVPEPTVEKIPDEWCQRSEELGTTGTLVVWSSFEQHRLTWKGARSTLENTEALSGRMYRKFIHNGKVDIRLVAALEGEDLTLDRKAKVNDPLYLMAHSQTPAPFHNKPMFERWGEKDTELEVEYAGARHIVSIRMSWARSETIPQDGSTDRGRTAYGKHAAKNVGLSIVRAGRELDLDSSWALNYDARERWWGVEVEFPPTLDEVFGVTNNKQAATVFSQMAQFNWENQAEPGERYMDFKDRIKEEGDTRYLLLDIVNHVEVQLSQIRDRVKGQGKGRRGGGLRHGDGSVEDTATTKYRERIEEGHKTDADDQEYTEDAQKQLVKDLTKNKHYDEDDANKIAQAVHTRGRRVIFVTAAVDSPAFFSVDVQTGGVTEVVFNSRHPAYEKLIKTLDTDVSESSDSDLLSRVQNASDTLKLLFAAWARYEEEDVPSQEKIKEIRFDWGKMAKNFLAD